MRTNAIYAPAGGWLAVTDEAHKMAASAKTPADTYGAIIYALGQLQQAGDVHTGFTNAFTAKLQAQGGTAIGGATATPPPTVSLVNRKLGFIALPAIGSAYTSPNARRYASGALSRITALQEGSHPCGWIVDLRQNTGGDDYPMLLSLGPILGDGRLIGFTNKKGVDSWTFYRNNTLSDDGTIDTAPVKVANFVPAPTVAVLIGPMTASAGEVVTLAFRGRAHTRSFGASTAGATTAPQLYRLADGAELHFAVVWYRDNHGNVYKHPITPDVAVSEAQGDNAVVSAAEKWLMSTTACSRTR